tara:strand:- start:516 stop:944 length:429 start_codon:yes stop_codon:yes gene_type:complete
MLLDLFFLALGHVSGAFILYLNHRFVFHGRLGKIFFLKPGRLLHARHHAHAYDRRRNNYIKAPLWGALAISSLILLSGLAIHWFFALGLLTFSMLYSRRHEAIHNRDNYSEFYHHHKIHHENPKVNFSGIYPTIDKIFGTSK